MIEILAAFGLLVLIVIAAFDVLWPCSVAIALLIAILWWLKGVSIFHHLWRPEYIAGYIVIGFVWVFFKWTRVVDKAIRNGDKTPPKWAEHSFDFSAYFFYWPIDAVAYLLSDFLQEVWKLVSRMVTRSFDRYAEWRFDSVKFPKR